MPTPTPHDRVPHDTGAEAAVLGACLLSATAVTDTRNTLTDPAPFWAPRHAQVWATITALAERGEPVDTLTVQVELGDNALEGLDASYLADLVDSTPGTANVAHYAGIVNGHARRRRVIELAHQLAELARTADTPDQALLDARTRLDQLDSNLTAGTHLHLADLAALLADGITPIEPAILHRTDGQALFYAGCMHTLQAPPSTGKSWVALLAVAEVLMMGGTAVYLDWEDSPASIVSRLLALAVDPAAITGRFAYAKVEGPWGPPEHTHAHQITADLNPDLVIIDGVAEAMAHDGLDENVAAEFMSWSVRVPRPLAATGAAVVMLDHTRKDTDKTDRYARGSGAKLAALDGAAYLVTTIQPYSRTRAGKIGLTVTKDRHGSVGAIGEQAAVIDITPTGGGEVVRTGVHKPPETTAADGGLRPPGTMANVSRLLAKNGNLTAVGVRDRLPPSTRSRTITAAISCLVSEGYVRERPGIGSTVLLELVRPFHDDDPPPDEPLFDPDPPPEPTSLDDWKDQNL